jgi:hypothetical protein
MGTGTSQSAGDCCFCAAFSEPVPILSQACRGLQIGGELLTLSALQSAVNHSTRHARNPFDAIHR